MFFDCISDDVNEIVESNIPTEPSKSFELLCADYEFMVVTIESSELLAMI